MSFVLDGSVTLAWLFEDEQSKPVMRLLDDVVRLGAVVPSLWRLEVANGLQAALRRRRIDAAFRDSALKDLAELDIEIDSETDARAWTGTVRMADRFGLTLYDSAYLELAERRRLALATLDQALRSAGQTLGLTLLGR